jgi:hypothetical protein
MEDSHEKPRSLSADGKSLRAAVDVTNREQWIAESIKWRARAELEIESYLRARYVVHEEDTVH